MDFYALWLGPVPSVEWMEYPHIYYHKLIAHDSV